MSRIGPDNGDKAPNPKKCFEELWEHILQHIPVNLTKIEKEFDDYSSQDRKDAQRQDAIGDAAREKIVLRNSFLRALKKLGEKATLADLQKLASSNLRSSLHADTILGDIVLSVSWPWLSNDENRGRTLEVMKDTAYQEMKKRYTGGADAEDYILEEIFIRLFGETPPSFDDETL